MSEGGAGRALNERGPPALVAGRYAIERQLGRGGMGLVYLARDRKLGRAVALKLLGVSHGPVAVARFHREARAACGLSHPNVVAIFDAGEEAGEPYIVEELLTGCTLRERLARAPLSIHEAIGLGLQCARGLQAAHDNGIIHRDLKPDNLFLTEGGVLKILDFGLAKLMPSADAAVRTLSEADAGEPAGDAIEESESLTGTGQMLGTVGYMAPEQVRGGEIDARADLFAFGAVLYELLSGQRAFRGASRVETSYAILAREPAPLPAEVPAALHALVAHCLRKDPAARPSSAGEIVTTLEALQFATPSQATPLARRIEHLPARVRVRRRWIAAAAALAIACALVSFAVLRPAQRPAQIGVASAPVVAVLPFSISGDPKLGYLSGGLAELLSAGISYGSVRTVSPQAVLRYVAARSGALELADAVEIARHFGASAFVLGAAVEVNSRVTVQASLHRVDAPGTPIAARSVGDVGALFAVIDELSGRLVAQLGGSSPPEGPGGRLARLATTLTSSDEALQAFLRGEAALRRDSWRTAREEFQQAVRLDARFALAHYRLAVAASLQEPGLAGDSVGRALANADRLSPLDRQLAEAFAAFLSGRAADAEARYRAIVAAHPDEVEAWFELGDLLYHLGPARGRSLEGAAEAFERVLVLDPSHRAAIDHLIDLAQLEGKKALVAAYAERALALPASEEGSVIPLRWARAWARGDDAGRAEVLADLKAPKADWLEIERVVVRSLWQADDLADAAVAAVLATERADAADRADGLDLQAMLDLARGNRRAARDKLAAAARLAPAGAYRYFRLAVSALEFLPASDAELRADLREALVLEEGSTPFERAGRLFLAGAIAARLGEAEVAQRAGRQLEQLREPTLGSAPQDLARSIAARLAARQGHTAAARSALRAMELAIPSRSVHLFTRLSDPLLRLRVGLASSAFGGHTAGASGPGSWAFYDFREAVWFAPVALAEARAADARSDRPAALRSYRRYLQLRPSPDAELLPEVHAIRARVAALERAD